MKEKFFSKHSNLTVFASSVVLAGALVTAGIFIGHALKAFKTLDRHASVRGIAEEIVRADACVWSLDVYSTGNNLAPLEIENSKHREQICNFLKKQGFKEEEIFVQNTHIQDKSDLYNFDEKKQKRYAVTTTILVKTSKIDLAIKSTKSIRALLKKNINFSSDPKYYYTELDKLRPQMMARAIASARQVVLKTIENSSLSVGDTRSISQGYFEITSKDFPGEGYDYEAKSSPDKKIRVVATVIFDLH